ncbi:MAG: hypothetical protein WC301_07665, partial [Candidatus Omnitrophota bacterium]
NILPYEYIFNFEDLDGMFRTAKFVRHYSAQPAEAKAQAYTELTKRLEEANKSLVAEILASEKLRSGDKVVMKRDILGSKTYKNYVKFITGEWKSAMPLFYKTYSDRAGWLGTVNNFYNPIAVSLGVVSASLLAALVISGGITLGGALGVFGVLAFNLALGRRGLDLIVNKFMARGVNHQAFGRPVRPDAGFEKAETSFKLKAFRVIYWATLGIAKLAWDTMVFHFALIAHSQLAGSVWLAGALNINFVLVAGLWLPFVLFFFLDTFSLMYLWEAGTGFIYSKIHGLGTIKSEAKKDRLKGNILNIMDEKFISEGATLNAQEKNIAKARIINFILTTLLAEDMVTMDEYNRNLIDLNVAGEGLQNLPLFSKLGNAKIRQRIFRFLSQMFDKDMPAMPKWVNLPTLTTMIPVGGNESIIYNFKEIDEVLDTGYTVLTYLIDHHKGEWENFIARMQREGRADELELQRMRDLKFGEQLGKVNAELEMQIRLWVSYRFQPFARTLNGLMHYVQALRLYAQIEHSDWSEEKIREEVNRKYQLLWGAQGYGDQLANNDPKAEETRYLAEMAYKLYGFIIDIAYIQKRDGVFYSVLARYNPASGKIEDVIANKLTAEWPLASEGKPGNQTHALRYVRSERTMTIDINQDYYVEQALKIPHLLTVFKDRNLDLVGYPEDIFTEDYSLVGKFHAIADRTFNALVQPVLFLHGARFHYGHPDVWRTSAIRQIGGVSRSYPVNEDIFGGYELTLRGRKIGYVMWIEAGKAREVSWATTDGIFRKFGMGATQQSYNRYLYYLNSSKNFNILQQLTHLYGGIGYYLRKPWVIAGLFAYLGFMLIGGVSGFAAFPAELLFAVFGIVLFAQSITFTGYAQYIIDNPTIRGTLEFWFKIFPLMSPFFMAHVFTNAAGVDSAQKGIATYVATGRGFMLSHLGIDQVYSNFAKSHIIPGAIGTAMAVYGMLLWQNITLIFSLPYVAIVFFAIVVPIISSRGSAPIFKVKMSNYASILKKDATEGLSKIISSSFHKVFPTKVSFANPINWLRAVRETGNVAIFVTSWALITALGFVEVGRASGR